MNTTQAQLRITAFLELKGLLEELIPETKVFPDLWTKSRTREYEFDHLELETMTIHWKSYIGCGDYDYCDEPFTLDQYLEQA